MGTPSPRCTVELKQKAAELYGKSGTTCAEVARGLGCDAGSLSDWAMKADAARPALDANPFQMVEDLRRRKRENERLKRESEMLLKASAFYATLGRPSSSGQLAPSNSAGATWYSATLVSKTFQFRVRTRYKGPNTTRIIRGALLDWLHLFGRFREDQACFPELDRGHVSQRRMNSEVVVPMHVVRQLDLQLARRAERLAVDGLGLQHLVGRLVDRVVVRAPLPRQRPLDAEDVEHLVDLRVVELAAAVRMEHLDVGYREPQRREGGPRQGGVLARPGGMADDLAVAQVDEQAGVVPAAADAHASRVAAHVGARRVPAELPGDHVRQVGLVGPAGMAFEPPAAICAGQAVPPHYPADAPAAGGYAVPGESRLDLAGPVAPAVGLVRRQHGGLDGVGRPGAAQRDRMK